MRGERGEKTLTVANHPNFTAQATEDDDGAGETVFRMLSQTGEHRLLIVLADSRCDTTKKLIASDLLWHSAYKTSRQQHGIAAIAVKPAVAVVALGGRAVNDRCEVSGDDDSVLAFLFGILADECLFYYFHGLTELYDENEENELLEGSCTRRNIGAEPVSPLAYGLCKPAPEYRGCNPCRTSPSRRS